MAEGREPSPRLTGPFSVLDVGVALSPSQDARVAALALRAGWRELSALPFDRGEVLGVAVPGIASEARRERLFELARRALAGLRAPSAPLPFVLAGPAEGPVADAYEIAGLIGDLARAFPSLIDPSATVAIAGGDEAGLFALVRATEWISRTRGPSRVLVGAVDSLLGPKTLSTLLDAGRVVPCGWASEPEARTITPGEGAAFLVLGEKGAEPRVCDLEALALLAGDSVDAVGVAACIRRAAGPASELRLSSAAPSDVRGEAFGEALRELAAASGVRPQVDDARAALGDLGAASLLGGLALDCALAHAGGGELRRLSIAGLGASTVGAACIAAVSAPPVPPVAGSAREIELQTRARSVCSGLPDMLAKLGEASLTLRPKRRARLGRAVDALGVAAFALAHAPLDEGLVALSDGLARASAALADEARGCERGSARRGHSRPELAELARAADGLAAFVVSQRERLLAVVAGLPATTAQPERGFALGAGSPALIALAFDPGQRPQLGPLPAPEDDEPDDDESPAAPSAAHATPDEDALDAADPALDAMASAWLQRRPHADATWSLDYQREVDSSLLAALDWLHAAAQARQDAAITRRLARPSAQPGDAFATCLALSCACDERVVRRAIDKARGASGTMAAACVDALALGASPAIDRLLVDLLVEDDETALCIALEVEARRRAVHVGATAARLFHRSEEVRLSAARALGRSTAREAAQRVCQARLSSEPAPRVRAELVVSLLLLRDPHAAALFADVCGELLAAGATEPAARSARRRLACAAAALGRPQELATFASQVERAEELELLGWWGRVAGVGPLLTALEAGDPEDRTAAARALCRIHGGVQDERRTSTRLVQGQLTRVEDDVLVLDPRAHRAFLEERTAELGAGKYRFGRRWEEGLVRAELAGRVRVADREMAAFELALASESPGCDTLDWAERQAGALALGAAS